MQKIIITLFLIGSHCLCAETNYRVAPGNATNLIISANQMGYEKYGPKRATAPIEAGAKEFVVCRVAAPTLPVYTSTVRSGVADFSELEPEDGTYFLSYLDEDGLPLVSSHDFEIEEDHTAKRYLLPMVQFMADARTGLGTVRASWGGEPWRDGTYYSFEIPSLLYLFMADPVRMGAITEEVDYPAEKILVESTGYRATVLQRTGSEDYGEGDVVTTIEDVYGNHALPNANCPDALELVHFGLCFKMERTLSDDRSSGDPISLHFHSQAKEYFAYFLYVWPSISEYFPVAFYNEVRDFTFANWGISSGLGDASLSNNHPSPLDIDPLWRMDTYYTHNNHPFKGRHAPGHSVLPNLLMWQVAIREGRSDSLIYLDAAKAQVNWMLTEIDWANPATTKGHRMSEMKTIPGLAHFLLTWPEEAPEGLADYIEEWADIAIERSHNYWDFRRYELTDTNGDGVIDWTLPNNTPAAGGTVGTQNPPRWNEPGNLGGFPACAIAAAWCLDGEPEKQARLRELAQGALDNLMGRNPLDSASPSRPELGFPLIEHGWTPARTGAALFSGPAGYLGTTRGSITSGPGSQHFPNNGVNDNPRYSEGWCNFNAALNMGVAYLILDSVGDSEPLD